MSERISNVLEIVKYVATHYKREASRSHIRTLRIAAEKVVAVQHSITQKSVSDAYRRQLGSEIPSADFDQALYDWLHSKNARLRSILLASANSYDDKEALEEFFGEMGVLVGADALQSVMDDIEALENRSDLQPTTRQALIDARKGQGIFRSRVLSAWADKCAVTSCTLLEVLRASHIKPWCVATDYERLDPENGFILIANLDALFDLGLISFDDRGDMLVSGSIDPLTRQQLQIPQKLVRKPSLKQCEYLAYHRDKRFLG
jgi:hypothetical protein